MAVTDYDFLLSRNEIVAAAFRKLGALALGETLSSEQLAQGVEALNLIVKEMQNDHVFLWSMKPLTITLAATTPYYAVSSDPALIGVDKAVLRESNIDTPLQLIAWHEYQDIADKAAPGKPEAIALDVANARLYVWPVPIETGTIAYLGISALKDLDSAASAGEFPAKWHKALVYTLAADLSPEYLIPRLERDQIRREAEYYYQRAKRGDTQNSDRRFVRGSYE